MRDLEFATGEFYHLYNRGSDKRTIFFRERDYRRFIQSLIAFNDTEQRDNLSRLLDRGEASITRGRRPLVDILSFSLMPNHFHLFVHQRGEKGIPKFMQRLGTAYTMYFNTKYRRTGVLYQGPFRAVHVDNDAYFEHLFRYLHLNPLELLDPQWKQRGVRDWSSALAFLGEYKWSSYLDAIGEKNFPDVLSGDMMRKYIGEPDEHKRFIRLWAVGRLRDIDPYIFEE